MSFMGKINFDLFLFLKKKKKKMSDEATIYKNDLVTLRLNRRQRRQQVAGNNSEFITGIVQRTGW